MTTPPVIEVQDLVVEYGRGRKVHRAVDGVTFEVREGECIGFIGANGAGKSTTIKAIMGFLFPTSGGARVFGEPAGSARSRTRIGYLPEVALYYPFMKARELLELYGGLSGVPRAGLRARIPALLEKVGLDGKADVLLREFSKGMQQRLGIAQALISEPEALIFDELSSGLDPLGRHDLRQVLLELKGAGRTIFFSSHELTEVEDLCDRVLMIHRGKIVTEAPVGELMKPLNRFVIEFRAGDGLPDSVAAVALKGDGGRNRIEVQDISEYSRILSALQDAGVEVLQTSSQNVSLEQYFIDLVREKEGAT